MRQWIRTIVMVVISSTASAPTAAEGARGFYFGAGAGYSSEGELNLQPAAPTEESLAAFGGFRLNSRLALEGYYTDINQQALLSQRSSNLYTQSYLGNGVTDNAVSTVAGLSIVTTLAAQGRVRPFARAGMHHYDLGDGSGQSLRGDGLLLGAGANVDLSRGWNARLEWERYDSVDSLNRNIFSASFEYKF